MVCHCLSLFLQIFLQIMTMGLLARTSITLFLMVFLLKSQTLAFKLFSFRSVTHEIITRVAILETTIGVCRDQALREGRDFVPPRIVTEESLAAACSSPLSAKGFKRSIKKIVGRNAWVDVRHVFSAKHHFDDESFLRGRDLITKGVFTVKASVKQQRYECAREKLGEVLHTLQDFYSHSNWREMGNRRPYSNLIKPSSPIENIADSATCRSCIGNNCSGNILEQINTQRKLTSGYFNLVSSNKPEGKCSHGGFFDRSSGRDPKGGINKDDVDASHGYLHVEAAGTAIGATKELLEDIRAAAGDSEFLRLMGFTQTSVLCFVIDTTGSMSDDIAEVRRVTSSIIESRKRTSKQPSEYILVPFNDPDYGPLTRTTDPELFKSKMGELQAHDGGDAPEMSLSGLQLALTGSPPQTEIFVFTDAEAKDKWLKSTILALIERTKSSVTFMLTNAFSGRSRISGGPQFSSRSSNPLIGIYQELAQASGGQAIEVTKATLPQATSIIVDTSSSSLVTVFQAVRDSAKPEIFTFFVDSSLQNLTIYITGNPSYYTITGPTGATQSNTEPSGPLGIIEKVGNFHTVRPTISDQTGQWRIIIFSARPYSIKAFGQSAVDFLFDIVELSDGPHPSYAVLNSRPKANSNVTLLVSMLGGEMVRPTEVTLVDASTSESFNGTLEEVAIEVYLATIANVPAGEFLVCVSGESSSSRDPVHFFQRQFLTHLRTSNVSITVQSDAGTLEPGRSLTLPFTVSTSGSGGVFNIRVSNDRSFLMADFPSTLTLETGGSVNDTVTLTAPGNTPSGTDVTLTIEAEAPRATDFNYAVLRISVVTPVTDITPPVCEIVSVNANCSGNCSLLWWDLSANITDRNGSGIQRLAVRQGLATLNTSTVLDGGVNVTLAFLRASCCFPQAELVVVDSEGNVGSCSRSVTSTVSPSTSSPTVPTSANRAERPLGVPGFFWVTAGIILLFQFT
ncbi:von Willebrand factor A domain-containing protein 7-like isoform X1 [Astyanax mexicanus]|uniref:von Willebrand factor A domain-containing protein 7-like isoform X1 n=1 Tax=Astyanax mexicanus TaxID=7994 RepID=A0A8T2LTS9_ASTMX|nr:von Willebrand factor A domain-containing protein 7-like isoform X1 [Astyanax mexicanus]